ncbi:MAG: hypothetical protein WCF95_06690 [bacterium]
MTNISKQNTNFGALKLTKVYNHPNVEKQAAKIIEEHGGEALSGKDFWGKQATYIKIKDELSLLDEIGKILMGAFKIEHVSDKKADKAIKRFYNA